ncbi:MULTISPECIES: DUF6603 domain-containing protein [Streptomycetaceae]|uniref:DUF6603 domain-containing protein n=1 Tax=Streptomycetaceae TaxID=2062 RepID=UPI000939D237|nr:DUF6603 domain-containing protein [Streptomyces sp. CB02056]
MPSDYTFGIRNTPALASARSALPRDATPVTQITINGRTLDLDIWDQEDDWTHTRGSAQDIPIGDLLGYLAENWAGSEIPGDLADLTLRNLTLEVLTTSQGSEWTFTVAAETKIGGATPVLLVKLSRSTLGDDGSPQAAAVSLSVEVGIEIGDSGHIWFAGEVDRASGGGYTIAASWSADDDGTLSLPELATALGITLPDGVPNALLPTLTSAAFRFDTASRTTVLAVTTEHTRSVLAAVPAEGSGATGYVWAATLEAVVTAKASDLPLVGRLLPAEDDIRLDGAAVSVCTGRLTHDQLTALNEAVAATETAAAGLPRFPAPAAGLEEGAALSVPYAIGGVEQEPLVALFPTSTPNPPAPRTGVRDAAAGAATVAWVRLDRTLGPLTVARLGLTYQDGTAWVLVDASFTASGLEVGADGLGLGLALDGDTFGVRTRLDGLGVAFDHPPVELSGALVVRQPAPAPYDLQVEGGLVVRTPPVSLSALGAYSHRADGFASMFVLGQLSLAGEGLGPPPFRVKGFLGGFGYNSDLKLPAPDGVDAFPLVTMMTGGKSDDPLELLEKLDQDGWVSPRAGETWCAVGLQFTSFELVESLALAVVEFGQDFTVGLLGLTTAAFPKAGHAIAQLQVETEALYQSSQGLLAWTSTLTPESFVIDPACKLTGGLALRLWLGGGHGGDALVTIGGYHPAFKRPSWYPDVPRLGFSWSISDCVSIRGEAYAALTPSAVMAGASLNVNFHAGPVKAWLTAYLDALVQWKPLYFQVDVGVDVGVSLHLWLFTITLELGVDVHLWGPPVGGRATFHVLFFHVTIPFGSHGDTAPDPLTWEEFLPQLPPVAQVLRVTAVAGLLPGGSSVGGGQSGAGDVWAVSAHGFGFTVTCAVPASELLLDDAPFASGDALGIRPMAKTGLVSQQRLTIKRGEETVDVRGEGWQVQESRSNVPKALWGTPLDSPPPVPVGGQDLVADQLTGFTVTVPPAALAPNPLTATEEALSAEDLDQGRLPVGPEQQPVGPVPHPWQDGDPSVVGIIAAEIASAPVTAARSGLDAALAALGVSPGTDDPLPGYGAFAAAGLSAEPLLVPAPAAA